MLYNIITVVTVFNAQVTMAKVARSVSFDEEILKSIGSTERKSLEHVAHSLIQDANRAGGRDNITVILLSFG